MKRAKIVVILILVAIAAVVVLQNTESVETRILWYSVVMPRAVLLMVTGLVGFAVGVIACFATSKRGA